MQTSLDNSAANCIRLWLGFLAWPLAMSEKYKRRYVGMISPDITISNHRLRWAVDGMRFTAPLQISENQSEGLHLFRWYTHTLRLI